MSTCGWHAASRGCDGDAVVTQDFTGLVDQFLFLRGVAVVAEVAGMGEDIAIDLVRIGRFCW